MSTGFQFGKTPTTSGQPTGNLFGTTGNSSSGLFGSGNSSWSFPPAGSTPSSSAEQKSAGNVFGAAPTTTTSSAPGFSFNPPATTAASSGSLFGTPKPAASGASLFGSTTPADSSTKPTLNFGNPSTTPAGPPPSASTFGASTGTNTGGGNLFGNLNKPPGDAAKPFSFTKPADATPSTQGSTLQPPGAGGLFASSQPAAASSTGSGFSFTPKTTEQSTAPTQSTGPSATPSFSFPANASSTTAASTAPSGRFFGAAPASTSAPSPSLFGAAAPASRPGQAATTQASSAGPFGSLASTSAPDGGPKAAFNFQPLSSQPPSSSAPTATSEAPKSMFGLGGNTTSAPSSGGLFGKPATTTAAASTATPASTAPAAIAPFGGLGVTTSNTTGAAPTSDAKLAASTSGPIPPAQSRLKNKTMDEILTRWATDLTKYSKEFKSQAETIARWDQTIVDNTAKIDKLYVKTRTCEKQTMSVEMQLSAVENQQAELEAWLSKYENEVDDMLAKENANPAELGGPDQERERTYRLAEKLQERLDDMGRDLESMVEEVNAANASLSKNGTADEPITQIVRILNSHLSQLQSIDQGTAALQKKVAEAQKTAHGLGYLNGVNSEARAAVDDFYRSYMGRR